MLLSCLRLAERSSLRNAGTITYNSAKRGSMSHCCYFLTSNTSNVECPKKSEKTTNLVTTQHGARCITVLRDHNANQEFLQVTAKKNNAVTRMFSTSTSDKTSNKEDIPFYGQPGPASVIGDASFISSSSGLNRIFLALHSASRALIDPTRAEAVAALGELTGTVALRRMHETMLSDPVGRQILLDRPIVSKATLPMLFGDGEEAINNINGSKNANDNDITFGQAYLQYLNSHHFDPDERDEVKYINDPDLAYIMLRYRQSHDYWHALTGLQPTVLGELGLKWLELFQTGFPIAALSGTVGSLALTLRQQQILWNVYIPWALRVTRNIQMKNATSTTASFTLLNVYYEKEFDTPLQELRDRLGIEPAPTLEENY